MQLGHCYSIGTVRALIILCVCYNACLAFINAHVFPVTKTLVILSEVTLLGSLLYFIYQTRFRSKDQWPIALLASVLFTTLIVFIATGGGWYVDALRNILIISVCIMVGSRMSEQELHRVFLFISILVFIFLFIEIVSLLSYANIFRPGDYYINTRGLQDREDNDTGLFFAALGFAERFSFGVFSGPRTSSIFLEQVSLGNFASLLAIYTAVFWSNITKHRLFYIFLIILIILSSNSRFGGLSAFIFFIGYFIFEKSPKYTNLLILPSLLFLGVIVINWVPDPGGDNLIGRMHTGYRLLFSANYSDFIGFGIGKLSHFADGGLAYFFISNTIFTAVPLLVLIKLYIPQNSNIAKRFVMYFNLYIFLNLVVSGNSIFSIKTAVLLWLMVGFIYQREQLILSGEYQGNL